MKYILNKVTDECKYLSHLYITQRYRRKNDDNF